MNEDLNIAFKVCCALIGNKLIATDSEIDSAIHNTQKIYPDTDPFLLKRLLLAKYCVSVDNFQVLEGRERRCRSRCTGRCRRPFCCRQSPAR